MTATKLEQHIEEIDAAITDAKQYVEMRDALLALQKNKNFLKVINEGYLVQEAARKAKALAVPALQDKEQQQEIVNALQGIGHFNQYLHRIMQAGNQAAKNIQDNENYRSQVLSGEIPLDEDQE